MPSRWFDARPRPCAVPASTGVAAVLPAFHYADAFEIELTDDDPRTLSQLMAARGSGRLEKVLGAIRDLLVAPYGLKPIGRKGMAPFHVLVRGTDEVIFGVDDRHVDVRVVYQLAGRQLTAATFVRVHNLFGRAYLLAILPFHFLVVRRQLSRIASGKLNG